MTATLDMVVRCYCCAVGFNLDVLLKDGTGRNSLCDDALKAVMGKPEVTIFEMTGLIGKHLTAV